MHKAFCRVHYGLAVMQSVMQLVILQSALRAFSRSYFRGNLYYGISGQAGHTFECTKGIQQVILSKKE